MARIYISDVIAAPIDRVWAVARDFNGHGDWHPRIATSRIEDAAPADQVGCVRAFSLSDGGFLRERLLAFSDRDHCFTYSILESPLPVANYVASFRCTPITEAEATFVEWWAEFDVSAADEADMRQAVGKDTFAAGIRALAQALP